MPAISRPVRWFREQWRGAGAWTWRLTFIGGAAIGLALTRGISGWPGLLATGACMVLAVLAVTVARYLRRRVSAP